MNMKSIIGLVAALTIALSSVANAGTSEQEYNYKLKKDDWEYTFRTREDRWHVEVGNKIGPIEVMYRYADLDPVIENRIKFTGEFFSYKDLTFEGRMEYRHFDIKESHWRWRFIAEYTPHIYKNLYLYAKWQPRWSFKDAGTKFDARDQLGITYKAKNWKITPFIERYSLKDYDKRMTVSGIHWEAKL
jgi:hypothetical protein